MTAAICGLCAWAVGRRLDRRRQIVLSDLVAIVAGAMGAARIVVDAHWFSDVVAGLAMGSLWVCLVLMLVVDRTGRAMGPGGCRRVGETPWETPSEPGST
jgi:undecaprenyl-diphosphatase